MKKYSDSAGLDISKKTFDAVLHCKGLHQKFSNDPKGFKTFIHWMLELGLELSKVLVCMENSGYYSLRISNYLYQKGIDYVAENPLQIKRSIGFRRGKSDKADAKDIASYGWLNREHIKLSVPPSDSIIRLQQLQATRELLVRQNTAIKNQIHGHQVVQDKDVSKLACKVLKSVLQANEKQIEKVEEKLKGIIFSEEKLSSTYKLCTSVTGIGLILAVELIVHTQNFTCFESWRKFAAYCGTVPYPYQSGTSIMGKPRIHPVSDRKMKSLLTMSAISSIRVDPELKEYFKRRVDEGKPKMSVINMIRNKLLARVFATVARGKPYVILAKYAA